MYSAHPADRTPPEEDDRAPEERPGDPPPLADPALALLDRLSQPIWIADVDAWRYRWANRAAVAFWRAGSLAELCARRNEASETVRAMFFHLRRRAAEGETIQLDHTVYPGGEPVRVRSTCTAYPLPEGRIGLFLEAQRDLPPQSPEVLRSSEAVRYAPLIVSTHELDGTTLAANALARRTLGSHFRFEDLAGGPPGATSALEQLRAGEHVSRDALVQTTEGPRWLAVEARRIPDAVTGRDVVVASAHDITARREAELAKGELISVVSHELRTPLTAIRGALSLLVHGRELGLPGSEDELLHIASENAARLGHLLDDLLDVEKLGAGRIELAFAPASLRAVIERTITLVTPLARAGDVRLVAAAEAAGVIVTMDQGRITQVLSNLLSNAIKHAPAGSEVRVQVERSATSVRVRVIDEGPGVPKAFRSRIFGRFAQADTSDTRRIGGAGLGLYIARKLIEHHGGELGFEEERDRGAAFFFDLPL